MQKLKNNEAQAKFTSSYNKERVLWRKVFVIFGVILVLES